MILLQEYGLLIQRYLETERPATRHDEPLFLSQTETLRYIGITQEQMDEVVLKLEL
ncbi:hypothetical protein ACIQ4Z_22485 [Peribacillus asahii]|uniref:hypothetical protein n=1 Tax=Peribacillus asahii TaxID=228899 RepID=UPI0038115FA4